MTTMWFKRNPYRDKGWVWLTLRHKALHRLYARSPDTSIKEDHDDIASELNRRFSKGKMKGHRELDSLDDPMKRPYIYFPIAA